MMFQESGKKRTISRITSERMLQYQFARTAACFDIWRIVLISR